MRQESGRSGSLLAEGGALDEELPGGQRMGPVEKIRKANRLRRRRPPPEDATDAPSDQRAALSEATGAVTALGARETSSDLKVGVPLPSATLSTGTSGFASGK